MDVVKKAMLLGLGVISLTKEKAEEAEKQEEELTGKISETVQKAITKIGLATKKDLEDISKRLAEIEKRIS